MIRNRIGSIITHLILCVMVVLAIIPFLSMVSTSFSQAVFELPFPPRILPNTIYLGNYITVLTENHFLRYLLNSSILAFSTTFFVLFVSSLSAYGFARFDFPGREVVFNIYLFTMMIPGVLNLIAQYTVINSIHLVDTYTAVLLIVVGGGVAGNTFFLRGFFEAVPKELEESIVIDGGNRWTIFRHIMLPLSKPALATLGIGIFSGSWGDFFTVLTFIKTSSKWTLPVALQLFRGEHATEWGLVFAGAVITFIPEMIIFIIAQKYFVISGGTDGAVKG